MTGAAGRHTDADARGRPEPRPARTPPVDVADPESAHGTQRTPTAPLRPDVAQRLQAAAGNRAVTGLVTRRRAATARPAVQRLRMPGAATGPAADPKFASLKADLRGKEQQLVAHAPATAEAEAAQKAAMPPQDDKEAQGKAANAERMNAAKPGEFDKATFVRAVNEAIARQAPKNLDEADTFAGSGKADAVKGDVAGQVAAGKQRSAAQIETATAAPPDAAAAKEKPVTPLAPDRPPATPGAPDAAKAVPDRVAPEATDLSAGPKQVDEQMAGAGVTEEQLARSNEPEFGQALAAKKEGEAHAATAPAAVRAAEAQTLAGAKARAGQAGATAIAAMATDRKQVGAAVAGAKTDTKGADEAKRAQVTATLQKVFDGTKKDVETILSELDKKVDSAFTTGEKAARDAFTAEHKRGMDAYKDRRYSGITGAALWVKDQFADLPDEANQIFVRARAGYVARMQQVISSVADLIGGELGRAKQRIAEGRAQLKAEVDRLPKDLQGLGRQAAAGFAEKFDELGETVKGKGQELVQTLATRYTEAVGQVDEEIAAEKEKNKGLISKAADAVGGVIKTILELKDLLLGVLAKAASAVAAIITDPIGFLGKLVSAVGAGLSAFLGRIGEHLKKGLVSWLLGALSGAGLQLPAKFDLRGILGMIASLLGLTWGAIRGRIVQRGVPEQAMGAVEQSVPLAQKLRSEGVPGIWSTIAEKVGDLKAGLFAKITQYLVPTVLIAGITWIISLLNPASAFVKACKMIVDIVSFLVQRGAQIVAFVNAVLDAVIAIAGGGTGGVPALIENALALSIPVLIGALAAILGIGGIAEKVKKFFQSLSKPVMKAVDWVVGKIVAFGKKVWTKLKSKFGKKDKPAAAEAEPTGADAARSDAVRAKATAQLQGRLGREVPPSQVRTVLADVHRGLRKEGLRSIATRPVPTRPGEFEVLVAASPAKVAMKFTIEDFKAAITWTERRAETAARREAEQKAKETGTDPDYPAVDRRRKRGPIPTALVPQLNGASLARVRSDDDTHAEVRLIAILSARWAELTAAHPKSGARDELVISITRSPCPGCAAALGAFAVSHGVALRVQMSSFYEGPRTDPETGKPTTAAERQALKEKSINALAELRERGVVLSVLSVEMIEKDLLEGEQLDEREKAAIRKRNADLVKKLAGRVELATVTVGS